MKTKNVNEAATILKRVVEKRGRGEGEGAAFSIASCYPFLILFVLFSSFSFAGFFFYFLTLLSLQLLLKCFFLYFNAMSVASSTVLNSTPPSFPHTPLSPVRNYTPAPSSMLLSNAKCSQFFVALHTLLCT